MHDLRLIFERMRMNLKNELDWLLRDGAPSYRYFKLVFTAALRLGVALEIKSPLQIQLEGSATDDPVYKTRRNYQGSMVLNGERHDDLVFIVDERQQPGELVTFWKKGQSGDKPGAKGGAHPFAELYIGFIRGKTVESKTFGTEEVAALCEQYNRDANFNVQAWIVNNVPADRVEPPRPSVPVATPGLEDMPVEHPPELQLLNKWQTDVLQTGVPYTNYEVDACVRNVAWGKYDERITLEMHWEDGKYVKVRDFGRSERYASTDDRRRIEAYLKQYDGSAARVRMILTVKGDSDTWTLACGTMLKRIPSIPRVQLQVEESPASDF